MAATRLRLTAHSIASLPGGGRHARVGQPPAPLERQSAELAGFYDRLAALVAKPGRSGSMPVIGSLPVAGYVPRTMATPDGDVPAAYRPDELWVGHHLKHLAAHSPDLVRPAERLAGIRRRPWWR
jgi:hypothetical protein